MNNTISTARLACTLALASVFASQVHADEGSKCHFHGNQPAAQAVVADCAAQRRDVLVKSGKLDASWRTIQPEKVDAVSGKKGKEWKVTFNNPAAPDPTKRALYMFFTESGNFMAANFSGK
jgi:hypothetical protein